MLTFYFLELFKVISQMIKGAFPCTPTKNIYKLFGTGTYQVLGVGCQVLLLLKFHILIRSRRKTLKRSNNLTRQSTTNSIFGLVGGLIAALIVLVGFNSFVIINPGQAGVLSVLGKAQDGALLEGIHFKPPLVSAVDVYDVTVQNLKSLPKVQQRIYKIYLLVLRLTFVLILLKW